MISKWSLQQKDNLLRNLLKHLSARGIASKWADSKEPYSDIQCECRDLFYTDFFRQVRNGVGHWSFLWDEIDSNPQIILVDWKTGKETERITLMEGEALQLAAFSAIEILDLEIFSRTNPRSERN